MYLCFWSCNRKANSLVASQCPWTGTFTWHITVQTKCQSRRDQKRSSVHLLISYAWLDIMFMSASQTTAPNFKKKKSWICTQFVFYWMTHSVWLNRCFLKCHICHMECWYVFRCFWNILSSPFQFHQIIICTWSNY